MNKLPWHISGKLHLTGTSRFIADEAPLAGMLHARFVFSPVAHATLIRMDTSRASSLPGIERVVTAADIPAQNMIGHVIKDEPLFPTERIMYVGQPLAMVLSEDPRLAEEAAQLIELEYKEFTPLLEIDAADAAGEWYVPERKIQRGEVNRAMQEGVLILSGETRSAGQEHFYMEGQRCRAIPLEGRALLLQTATQSTMEVQEVLSHVLGIPAHEIIIDVPRLGGAFGGKERAATLWACLAGLGAYLTRRPVEVKLSRDEDMAATGKRHPFQSRWQAAFDSDGTIKALDVELLCNGGAYADLSIAILERAMFHAENAYRIPHIRIRGRACRTNLPPNTAFRGFGAPQGIFVIENILQQASERLGIDPLEIRLRNTYQPGDIAPYGQSIVEPAAESTLRMVAMDADYQNLLRSVQEFNASHKYQKRGIGICPVKFGISFTTALLNQGSALVWVYIDGSVSVSTGGVEMGQELTTKVAMVASRVLGIPVSQIRVESSNSQRVGNASPTAASTGSDINGNAARIASEKIASRLKTCAVSLLKAQHEVDCEVEDVRICEAMVYAEHTPNKQVSFAELVRYAYNERVALGAYGYYRTPGVHFDRDLGTGRPFHYYVYGASISLVEVDTISGEHRVLDTWIVHENGSSLHDDVDRGQIIGAFVQSCGWCTMEELPVSAGGCYLAVNPSTYKIPTVRDIPENLHLKMVSSQNEEASVFGSKAVGEPPFIYGMSVWFAIREALKAAGAKRELGFPATPEAVLMSLEP
jgi:xanthine dehydrogenase large subunit